MTILNIETSTRICSAAIGIDGEVAMQRISDGEANHISLLPVYISELLDELKAQGRELDAVAVSGGPGSYTGLRIGVSTAKGVCYAKNLPLLAIDTTQVIAAGAKQRGIPFMQQTTIAESLSADLPTLICPLIDARRMEVYAAAYDYDLCRLTDIQAYIIDDNSFSDLLERHVVYFAGDGAEKCKGVIKHPNARFLTDSFAEASNMCQLAEERMKQVAAGGIQAESVAYYTPFYLKDFVAAPSHVKGLR